MSNSQSSVSFTRRVIAIALSLALWSGVLTVPGQTQQSGEIRDLPSNQTLEREMTGGETHRYKFEVGVKEFFQVRVEKKGIDLLLALTDASGNHLAVMGSPSSKQGAETLTFISENAGGLILDVVSADAKAEKGIYTIRREAGRAATAKDRRRVEVEQLYIAGIMAASQDQQDAALKQFLAAQAGWEELADGYMAEVTTLLIKRLRQDKAKAMVDEAVDLMNRGEATFYRTALAKFQEARQLFQDIGDKRGELQTLVGTAAIFSALGEKTAALKFLEQALPLSQATADKYGEAITLTSMGAIYAKSGEMQQALDYYNRALSLHRAVGNKEFEATTLNNIGTIYDDLGEKQQALDYYNQALLLLKATGHESVEATTLNNIAEIYADLGEEQQARDYYNQALLLFRAESNKSGEATTLSNIGAIYAKSGGMQQALDYYNQALPLFRAAGNKNGEASTLSHFGGVYDDLGEKQRALAYYNQALLLYRAVGNKSDEAMTMHNMMYTWRALGNLRMAVFYGKQSVNNFQALRQAIQGLDNETQKSFLRSFKPTYRGLAEALMEDGQLAQAVQVLNLYQDQQFFDFNRNLNEPVKQLMQSPREAALVSRYELAGERVRQVGSQIEALKHRVGNRQPNEQEAAQLGQLEAALKTTSESLLAVLKDSETEFSKPRGEQDKVPTAADVTELQTTLRELSATTKQKTVALYTLVGEEHFRVLLVTPDDIKPFATPIRYDDFNQAALRFYAVLQLPDKDPRPLGKKLYDTILGPVAAELQKNGAQALLWALDGSLRYVPMAALSPDGKGYLVEQYQSVVVTRASRERMMRAVSPVWTGTGFGGSRARKVKWLDDELNFSALPGVTAELQSIFGGKPSDKRILTGTVFQDDQFTKTAFYKALQERRPLVHISSHFAFRPGDDSRSFLLLGDGTTLSLNELKKQGHLFEGVELLTLSACKTAAQQANANGREIDGFAELAQRLGASAVMATLWSVSDNSTPYLMSDFYRLRHQQADATKTVALRQAQLALLNGTAQVRLAFNRMPSTNGPSEATLLIVLVPPGDQRSNRPHRDTGEIIYVNQKDAPPYPKDTTKPYAHPYYWAPFVLFGNWK
jgi:CHAT domain-containing protein/uncharacterized protein HemY